MIQEETSFKDKKQLPHTTDAGQRQVKKTHLAFGLGELENANRESPAQFENQIKPREYVRRITHSTIYKKSSILTAGTGVRKISSVVCGFSPFKSIFLIT